MNCKKCGVEMRVISNEEVNTVPKTYRITHKCPNKKCSNKQELVATYTIAEIQQGDNSQE